MTRHPQPSFVFVPVADLAKYADTLKSRPWEGAYRFGRKTVQSCLDAGLLESRPWDFGDDCIQTADNREDDPLYHARRVAFLVANRCHRPISIDVGIPALGFQPKFLIDDGCHRLAAAIFRKDAEIAVDFSGSVREFDAMFPRQRQPSKSEVARADPKPSLHASAGSDSDGGVPYSGP